MIQGWKNDDYLILFKGSAEINSATVRYSIPSYLPELTLIGILNWDDFIVRDLQGQFFTVPTLPLSKDHLNAYELPNEPEELLPDQNFGNRIKWYVQPIIFGGDPQAKQNISWITMDQHIELVKWWNAKFLEIQR